MRPQNINTYLNAVEDNPERMIKICFWGGRKVVLQKAENAQPLAMNDITQKLQDFKPDMSPEDIQDAISRIHNIESWSGRKVVLEILENLGPLEDLKKTLQNLEETLENLGNVPPLAMNDIIQKLVDFKPNMSPEDIREAISRIRNIENMAEIKLNQASFWHRTLTKIKRWFVHYILRRPLVDERRNKLQEIENSLPTLDEQLNTLGQVAITNHRLGEDKGVIVKLGNSPTAKKYFISFVHHSPKIQEIGRLLGKGGDSEAYELIDRNLRTRVTVLKIEKVYMGSDMDNELAKIQKLNPQGLIPEIQLPPLSPLLTIIELDRFGEVLRDNGEPKMRRGFEDVKYDGNLNPVKGLQVYKLNKPLRLNIIYQIVKGVEYFAERHLVHGDLKPDNIFYKKIGDEYEVRIADFGGAWFHGETRENLTSSKNFVRKKDHNLLGDLLEGSQDEEAFVLGQAMDIYSLGVTLYTLLTGHPYIQDQPFEESTLEEAEFKELLPLLEQMCAPSSEDRPPINKIVRKIERLYPFLNPHIEEKTDVLVSQ